MELNTMLESTSPRQRRGTGMAGFTLIELMVVVAVVAILAAIAYANYTGSVVKSRRAAATGCLLEAAQFMEREYTTNMRYDGVAVLPAFGCSNDLADFYTFRLNGAATASQYSVEAVPLGGQATADTKCATLRLNQVGTRSSTGTAPAADCW